MNKITFKEMQRNDFSTFLNLDEFAETVEIIGDYGVVTLDALFDRDTFRERRTQTVSLVADGVESQEASLFCREKDLGYRPLKNSELAIDGQYYIVKNCISNAGILEISLEVHMT